MQLNTRYDHHPERKGNDGDHPACVVRSSSTSFGVGPVSRNEQGDDQEEESDGDEWTKSDTEVAFREADYRACDLDR